MTRLGLKRTLFWSLLAGASAVSVWWMLTVPYRPGAVLDAIPENAAWVSIHQAPAARWSELSSNSAVRALAEVAGLDLGSLGPGLKSARDRTWFNRLGRREVALAHVPEMPGSGAPAWVISCWAGGYSQRMRWLMGFGGHKPVVGRWLDPTHPVWRLKAGGLSPGWHASLGIWEGLAVLALSPDPVAARDCLLVAERDPRVPSVRTAGMEARAVTRFRTRACPDRGWARLPGGDVWVFEAETINAEKLTSTIRRLSPVPEQSVGVVKGDLAPLGALAGKAEAVMTAPWPRVRNLLASRAGDWVGPLDALVREAAGTDQARIVAAVFGGEHAARIKSLFGGGIEAFIQGLKVPTFVAAIPVTDEAAAQAAMTRLLDRMNKLKPYGLVLRPAGVCYGRTVTAVEGTREGLYKDFLRSEQAVFTVAEGWLIVGSHQGAMESLIPLVPHGAALTAPTAGSTVRVKGRAFGQTAGKFLAALSLVYMATDTPESGQARERTAELRHRIQALGVAGDVEIDMGADDAIMLKAQ